MINLKTYNQWLLESKTNPLIDTVMDRLEPTIEKMLNQTKEWYLKEFEREMSKYDETLYRLTITYNLCRSFEVYALPTDELQSLSASGAANGTITIFAKIRRGSESFPFETDVIYAGGHNIQRLHYRYITKTRLPKEGSESRSKEIADQIKKLSKAEKINLEIQQLEARIKMDREKAQKNAALTDDQILDIRKKERSWFDAPSWEEIVKRGADKNYDYDEEKYHKSQEEYQRDTMSSWKRQNIQWPEEDAKTSEKTLIKLRAKLNSLL